MVFGTTCKIEVEIVSRASLTFRQQFGDVSELKSFCDRGSRTAGGQVVGSAKFYI